MILIEVRVVDVQDAPRRLRDILQGRRRRRVARLVDRRTVSPHDVSLVDLRPGIMVGGAVLYGYRLTPTVGHAEPTAVPNPPPLPPLRLMPPSDGRFH